MPIADFAALELQSMGHEVSCFGAFDQESVPWPALAMDVACHMVAGKFDQAVLFCWTGTGVCLAANKVKGVRAALCHDAQTAAGARKWNDANVLCLSLRTTTEAIAREILQAWLSNTPSEDPGDVACLAWLAAAEEEAGHSG
jgi:ribose 5-phosphate isomerase B